MYRYLTMKFSLFVDYGALNSKPVFSAFESSLKNAGHQVVYNSLQADVAVIWSVLWNGRMAKNKAVWDTFRQAGKPVIVLEIGGIKRGTTWKVGLNGVNRDAYFAPSNQTSDRADLLKLSTAPWRTSGEYILLCSQHEKSQQWDNMPRMSAWVMKTIEEIQAVSSRPIIFRPHPRFPLPDIERQYKNVYKQHPKLLLDTYDDFDLTYNNVWAVVNYSSNPGVQAVLAGIPAFVGSSSLAFPVGNHSVSNIENPVMPDRQQWVNDLAHTEYTVEEIANGLPLKNLTHRL